VSGVLERLAAAGMPSRGAERVVPARGSVAGLTAFTSAAMAFLAVFALALSLAAGRLADRWQAELAQTATVRIAAPEGQMEARVQAVLAVLSTTPGIGSARPLDSEEQRALLAPWFGPDLPLERLPVPRLIEVIETGGGPDVEGLRQRLAAEAPGAVYDDHGRWRAPLARAADRLRLLGGLVLVLIGAAGAAMVTLAANASLASNAQVIGVLRLVGARDAYIARAFVRRFTRRAALGAAVGTVLGMLMLLLLPAEQPEGAFLTGLGLRGGQWFWPLVIPLLGAAVAFLATRHAAMRALREVT